MPNVIHLYLFKIFITISITFSFSGFHSEDIFYGFAFFLLLISASFIEYEVVHKPSLP